MMSRVLARRLSVWLIVFGLGLVVAACSSSAISGMRTPTPPSVSACSLLSAKEASAAFGAPVQPSQCRVVAGNQIMALYAGKPGVLIVSISWNKAAVHAFTV
jgi:hypothetical protein